MKAIVCLTLAAVTLAASTAQAAIVLTYQEGVGGYTGTQDTWFTNNDLTTDVVNGDAEEFVLVNRRGGGGNQRYGLLRFDNIFGAGAGQIDPSTDPDDVVSATLSLWFFVVDTITSGQGPQVSRLTTLDWSETDSNNTLWTGSAPAIADTVSLLFDTQRRYDFDVTAHVKTWLGDPSNYRGWLVWENNQNADTISQFRSSEYAASAGERPLLTVNIIPEPASLVLAAAGGLLMLPRRRAR